ncbi:PREDICTED: vesicle-associated membrane protein-associated protein A [Drosophila arizonae]|uniref:Vesicle-associated membrane protein-associated protein A n=1 Tax=Drosophila arizonae TaxID=7263 RepID=A0ABM1P017_DROAR|nr:PREDICTED: vesicle-associated membrane protein-associated protein A [Drosophila arizonae]
MAHKANSDLFCVSPKNMIFYAPYDRVQKRLVTLLNPTGERLLFKVLTNAPWQYNAIPNCGFIEPYNISEICISLHHFEFERDKEYSHRVCIQCIRAPLTEYLNNQTILCIFKQVRRSKIHNVRVPIELKPEPICIPQHELEGILQNDVQKLIWDLRPINTDYMAQLKEVTMRGHKNRCSWVRMLLGPLILISTGLAAGEIEIISKTKYSQK